MTIRSQLVKPVLALAAAFAALTSSAAANAGQDATFFTTATQYGPTTAYHGCYATMSDSADNAESLRALSYNHYLDCDARSASCYWSSAVSTSCNPISQGYTDFCCTEQGGGTIVKTNDWSIRSVDITGTLQGKVCICQNEEGDHSCITLGSKWYDLRRWPAYFRYVRASACTEDELVDNYDVDTYPAWQVTTADAAKNASGVKVILQNQFARLVFTKTGELEVQQVWGLAAPDDPEAPLHPHIWQSPSAGAGGKVEFQSDGNICLRDSNVNIVWCTNTYEGGGPTGKKAVDLRLQESCNLTAWAADGTLVWTTDLPFCTNHT